MAIRSQEIRLGLIIALQKKGRFLMPELEGHKKGHEKVSFGGIAWVSARYPDTPKLSLLPGFRSGYESGCDLAKVDVEGSNPFSRSTSLRSVLREKGFGVLRSRLRRSLCKHESVRRFRLGMPEVGRVALRCSSVTPCAFPL